MGFEIQIFGWPPNTSSVGEKKNLLLIGALLLLEAALFAFAWSHWFWVSWRLTNTPRKQRDPSPTTGQHSVEVFQNLLGLPATQIADLVERGITGETPAPEK